MTLLLSCFVEWDSFTHLMCFVFPKLSVFLKTSFLAFYTFEIILYYYYWYFIRPWNQDGVLHQKLVSMCVIVLSGPVNHKHENLLYCFPPIITYTWDATSSLCFQMLYEFLSVNSYVCEIVIWLEVWRLNMKPLCI